MTLHLPAYEQTSEDLARRRRQPNDAAELLLEPQNIEQGMSNEEGHELTDQIAKKNAKIQEVYETANSRNRNQPNQTSRVFLRLFVAISSFFLRHSLFDIHLFVFRWSLNSCQKDNLSRICSTEDTERQICGSELVGKYFVAAPGRSVISVSSVVAHSDGRRGYAMISWITRDGFVTLDNRCCNPWNG